MDEGGVGIAYYEIPVPVHVAQALDRYPPETQDLATRWVAANAVLTCNGTMPSSIRRWMVFLKRRPLPKDVGRELNRATKRNRSFVEKECHRHSIDIVQRLPLMSVEELRRSVDECERAVRQLAAQGKP